MGPYGVLVGSGIVVLLCGTCMILAMGKWLRGEL